MDEAVFLSVQVQTSQFSGHLAHNYPLDTVPAAQVELSKVQVAPLYPGLH